MNNTDYNFNLCGIDSFRCAFKPEILIDTVRLNNGRLAIFGKEKQEFEDVMHKLVMPKNGYDDGYTKDIYENAVIKLNGIYFENYAKQYFTADTKAEQKSSGIFSLNAGYERGADFEVCTYKNTRRGLEVKNCKNMESACKVRTHNSTYLLVNSREEKKIRLLCRLQETDNPANLEHYEMEKGKCTRKVIDPWWHIKKIFEAENYNLYSLGNTWKIRKENSSKYGECLIITAPYYKGDT